VVLKARAANEFCLRVNRICNLETSKRFEYVLTTELFVDEFKGFAYIVENKIERY